MNLATIRDEWQVPARPGQRVKFKKWEGEIVGCSPNGLLAVRFDGDAYADTGSYHPSELTYLKDTP